MFFKNLSKRKILLLIINALISILMISCVIFLYHYLPASHQRTFTVEKDNSVHIAKSHYGYGNSNHGYVSANVRISSARRASESASFDSQEEAIDDTIDIDNDGYSDENYDNSGNYDKPVTAPVTIIERPVERNQLTQDDDQYYSNYDETDDEDIDIVSSGNGKIIVNIRKPLPKRTTRMFTTTTKYPEPMQPVVENVYSVSSEIVSNLKNQYSVEDTKQINKADRSSVAVSSDFENDKEDGPDLDEWIAETDAKGKRLIGNNKSLVERSRQLLLCESARTGELCRMLFKGTVG